jgi:hypothetical protein
MVFDVPTTTIAKYPEAPEVIVLNVTVLLFPLLSIRPWELGLRITEPVIVFDEPLKR